MSQSLGRSVRLFLVDGKATGLITAEIMNWTGHVLAGQRADLPRFLARPEVGRTGIYLLYGPDPDAPDQLMLYIGESDQVGQRLKQHNQDDNKLYWERACVITSKDQNITKAHARYLEARLIAMAQTAGRARLDNGTAPPPPALPEADRSDMEYFIEQLRLVLPVLGLDVLRESPKPSALAATAAEKPDPAVDSPLFELVRSNGVKARAREIDGAFVVLKDALGSPKWTSQNTHSYSKLHQKLRDGGKLVLIPDQPLVRFSEDIAFASPSAASSVLLGRPDNGRTSWIVAGSKTTYRDWQDQQIQTNVLKVSKDAGQNFGTQGVNEELGTDFSNSMCGQ